MLNSDGYVRISLKKAEQLCCIHVEATEGERGREGGEGEGGGGREGGRKRGRGREEREREEGGGREGGRVREEEREREGGRGREKENNCFITHAVVGKKHTRYSEILSFHVPFPISKHSRINYICQVQLYIHVPMNLLPVVSNNDLTPKIKKHIIRESERERTFSEDKIHF